MEQVGVVQHYVLLYEVVDNFVARRAPHRAAHLARVRDASARGELILAGALGDPPTRALLVFRSADRGAAQAFAEADPYVREGLVRRWDVQPWAVVAGGTP
ncbi:MAG TPA: YciI-like protein [bacterium]|nr:YciI-like protein [bacterium]